MQKTSFNPDDIAAPVGGYAHGCLAAEGRRILFVSGQIPAAPDGSIPPDFESQARNVWRNIESVLREAGMGLDNLVKITAFLTDRAHVLPNRKIRQEVLGDRRIAMSAIIAGTLDSDWLLEVEAIAMD
ncbi:RidA family protein [Ferrovibrio sp.]|uniref:RidA family protein n=1 Tax=Ferrovibrio sp. TaxID=1917215 RepID=UPI00311E947F